MSGLLRLKVVTPDGPVLDKEVASVSACSEIGEFCVLPEHRPILASLRMGRLVVTAEGGETEGFVTDSGFLEAGPDHVNVMTQRCVAVAKIDKDEVQAEISELEARLKELGEDGTQSDGIREDLRWAKVRAENVGLDT